MFIIQNVEDDEGLPEISVLGPGSYRFPAAQRAAANALAAQLRGTADNTRVETAPKPPVPVREVVRAAPPAPSARALAIARSISASNILTPANAPAPAPSPIPALAATPRQPPGAQQGPTRNAPRRTSTLSFVQAALAGFVPPPSSAGPSIRTPAPRPTPAPQPSRTPAFTRGVSPAVPASQARTSFQRPPPHVPRPAALPPSTAGPSNRRMSVPSTSRPPLVPSPPVQPRPPPPQPPPPSQGQSDRSVRLELEALRAQIADVSPSIVRPQP